MTLYAGETTRVKTTAKDFDDVPLENTDVTSATIQIDKKVDSTEVLATTNMSWDTTHLYWYYDWNTSAIDPGAYRAKITLTGATFVTWEYQTIRLQANPS